MSGQPEPTSFERVGEPLRLQAGKVREVRPRDLGVRFVAGGLTSIAAGLITLAFGARVGGLLLAFPAILAASLTLIEEQEDSEEAREDARGAVLGGLGLAAFGAVAAVALLGLPGSVALGLAALAWVIVAVGGYLLIWR